MATGFWGGFGSAEYDIVHDYRWTLSDKFNSLSESLDEVPYVKLTEYKVNESTIKTQLNYYITGAGNAIESIAQGALYEDALAPYENLFPKSEKQNEYIIPYFDEVNFELNTPQWASLDTLEAGSKFASGIAGVLGGEGWARAAEGIISGVGKTVTAGLALAYPKIGIMDRPKLFQNHEYRTIQIKFPLFNTVDADDWKKNRTLCWLLVYQNLFTKRDIITGLPPVFYEVKIPGQHYSYAACVTNLTIYNRGNMRRLNDDNGQPAIVPDAYEVNMTLTDMVMPSRNLLQQIINDPIVTVQTATTT